MTARPPASPGPGGEGRADRDDTGGAWIVTAVVLGVLAYLAVVVMAVAGFAAAVPLVVLPPAMVALIGANSLLGGGRGRRSPGQPAGRGQVPLSPGDPGPASPAVVPRPRRPADGPAGERR